MLSDGKQIVSQVDNLAGFPGQPMSRSDIERKFRGNVGSRWPADRTDAVLQALWALETVDDISAFMGKSLA